jgi:hypothetical protein
MWEWDGRRRAWESEGAGSITGIQAGVTHGACLCIHASRYSSNGAAGSWQAIHCERHGQTLSSCLTHVAR